VTGQSSQPTKLPAAPAAAGVRLTSYSTRARSRLRKAADLLHGIKIATRALADTEAFEQSRRDRKRVPVTVAVVCGSRRGSRNMHPSAANMTPHPTENGIRQNLEDRQAGQLPGRPARSIWTIGGEAAMEQCWWLLTALEPCASLLRRGFLHARLGWRAGWKQC
jgi:hypothetical protein